MSFQEHDVTTCLLHSNGLINSNLQRPPPPGNLWAFECQPCQGSREFGTKGL